MKYLFLLAIVFCAFISCKKSDGNTAPVIKFIKITPEIKADRSLGNPILTIQIEDADGDYGFLESKDTSYIYVKNLTNTPFKLDSFKLPSNLGSVNLKNLKVQADVDLSLNSSNGSSVLAPRRLPTMPIDTMYFEVYMKDFKKNKSNVIKTDNPMLFKY